MNREELLLTAKKTINELLVELADSPISRTQAILNQRSFVHGFFIAKGWDMDFKFWNDADQSAHYNKPLDIVG